MAGWAGLRVALTGHRCPLSARRRARSQSSDPASLSCLVLGGRPGHGGELRPEPLAPDSSGSPPPHPLPSVLVLEAGVAGGKPESGSLPGFTFQ